MQCGQDLAWPQYYPPFPESTFQRYLKRSVRKDFSFPDHWHMFAQIYFEGISSTLLSFLPKELRRVFQNHIYFLSLSLFIPLFSLFSVLAPLSFFLPCPTWVWHGFYLSWRGKGCWCPGLAPLHCWPLAFLAFIYIANQRSCKGCRNFCQPTQCKARAYWSHPIY